MTALRIPALTNEDRLPHSRAVWRAVAPVGLPASLQISVEYAGGSIEQTTVGDAPWQRVVRYRFGWAPSE